MIRPRPYRDLLRIDDVRRLFVASLVGRLPIGMAGLAILLLVQSAKDSFAAGGAATGCYVAGLAGVSPMLGRVIDRSGPHRTLLACALLFPASLCALLAAVKNGLPAVTVLLCATAAGATFPPITVCMRTYLRQRLRDEAHLSTAYSLDSVLIELMFIVGPMLVAVFMALTSPAVAVWFAAGCGLVGALLFWRSPSLAAWKIELRGSHSLVGPLAAPPFVGLIAIVACYSLAFGLTEIGIAAYAAEAGTLALAGVFLGLMSAGSAVGGLVYGSRSWHGPLLSQFALMLAVMGAGLAVLTLPWPVLMFGALSIAAGVVMAPALIIQSMLVAKMARPEHVTEAFTWSTTALLAGVGLGMSLGGALVEAWRSSVAFGVAATAAGLAALGAMQLGRLLGR